MDQLHFRIPKQTDENLLLALAALRDELAESVKLRISIVPHHGVGWTVLTEADPTKATSIEYIVNEHSQVMTKLRLVGPSNEDHQAVMIVRKPDAILDEVELHWPNQQNEGWLKAIASENRSRVFVRLTALARQYLKACDSDASLSGTTDNEWSRYRDSQQAILNSLAETQRTSITELTRRSLEAEQTAREKYQRLEEDLKVQYEAFKKRNDQEHSERMDALAQREITLKAKEESFNTREPRYVARQEQQKQIEDLKRWLDNWTLTAGTKSKRWTVAAAYVFGVLATAGFTIWFGSQTGELLGKQQQLSEMAWWQWLLLTAKSIVPFAAFTTFLVYFIRWAADWARQHAEEEFRNRSRVLDIGRSAWLLEAVRDAQDNQRELPPELMKELARNLFADRAGSDAADIHPNAIGELLLQGLSSIRVKASDGSEVEAIRDKKAK